MFAGPQIGSASATRRPSVDQLRVLDRHALDRLAALRLDHRARNRVQAAAVEVAEHVDRELLARAHLLHHRVDRRVARGRTRARRGRARGRCAASRSPRAPSRAPGSDVRGHVRGQPGRRRRRSRAPRTASARGTCPPSRAHDLERRQEHKRAELVAVLGEHDVVEVGERDDQRHVVLLDELRAARATYAGVVDPRRRARSGRRGTAPGRAGSSRSRPSSRRRGRTR